MVSGSKLVACGLFIVAAVGCGGPPADLPDIGAVSGVVTLDGQPLENARVMFTPDHSRPSGAMTDANGRYELVFNEKIKGAAVGKHKVRITLGSAMEPEKLPAKYNIKTELTADVKPGPNEDINFDLKSK